MNVGFAIVGFIIGIVLAGWGGHFLIGAFGGLLMGLLFGRLGKLEQRLRKIESGISTLSPEHRAVSPALPAVEEPSPATEELSPLEAETTPSPRAAVEPLPTSVDMPEHEPVFRTKRGPSVVDRLLDTIKHWFTTGNVPVKIGIIVTFIGVSFLLKYAVERQVLVIPLELRLLAVAAAGLVLVIIGWRLRGKVRVYALSLQGGGIGILYLTIFAALRIWNLLPPTLAFILLVALTVFIGALAVLQNASSLAILGIAGGFMAPVLTSTGQDSHVTLFSYYLVLNGAILGIAWFRAWRSLNLVGFVFTFVIGSVWGYQYYKPELLLSTQPFLVMYFLFYQAIAILYALRQPPQRIGIVDGTLVFGTPAIVFMLQAALVEGLEYALAISAALVALFYALTATVLYRKKGEYLRLMAESYMALAVAFATVAIPLAFDARWTSAAWALEGAALVWVGVRQGRELAKLAGVALVLFSGLAMLEHGWRYGAGLPVLNGNVLGGVLVSLGALFVSRLLDGRDQDKWARLQTLIARFLFLWGAAFWLGTGWMEISDRSSGRLEMSLWLAFVSASVFLDGWLARRWQWSMARWAAQAYLPLMLPLAAIFWMDQGHFLTGPGWLAWPLAWAVQVHSLRAFERGDSPLPAAWHAVSLLFLAALLTGEVTWRVDDILHSRTWAGAAGTVVPGIAALLVWRTRKQPPWPVAAHWAPYLVASLILVSVQTVSLILLSVELPGDPAPIPYIPVLNPFDIAMLFVLLTTALSVVVASRSAVLLEASQILLIYRLLLAAAALVLTTLAVVRGVHHYADIPWRADALTDSVMVQTALSIYWGLLGFCGMVWGARSQRWLVWVAGAGFMAVVVVKLFLVDLGNTGTVARIVSFIGTGALLVVVGYFAPAPPRRKAAEGDAAKTEEDAL